MNLRFIARAIDWPSEVYVANRGDATVSAIATATNMVIPPPIKVGPQPVAFGQFIQPLYLAGTRGDKDCIGDTVSALAQQFGGLAHAADTLGFASVKALQDTIKTFCDGPAAN
jgi:YVTN family beta-propeller protein